MTNEEATIQTIAHDIRGIKEELKKMNGRVANVEANTKQNEKDIAVLTTRCQLVTHYTDDDVKQMLARQSKTEERIWSWMKSNGAQVIQIVLLVIVLIELAGHAAP